MFRVRINQLLLLSIIVSLFAGGAKADPPKYSLTQLNMLDRASAINNGGDILGTRSGKSVLLIYKNQRIVNLRNLSASGLDDCDDVVGTASFNKVQHAALFRNNKLIDLDPTGAAGSSAYAINNHGAAVGAIKVNGVSHPALFENGTVKDLTGTSGAAFAINLSGEIMGNQTLSDSGQGQMFIVQNGTVMIPIYAVGPGYNVGIGLNDYGEVVGFAGAVITRHTSAFLYAGHAITIAGLPSVYGQDYATGINNAGEIVGNSFLITSTLEVHAFLNRLGTSYDLIDLIDPADPLAKSVSYFSGASGINDSGWIVAAGVDAGGSGHPYLLIKSEPAIQLERVNGGCDKDDGQ